MGTYEATNILHARINNIDPENASKIMGCILINLEDIELIRLASSPDRVLNTVVVRVKNHLRLSSTPSAPSSPLSLSHVSRSPNTANPFSCVSGNSSSPSSLPRFPNNNPISPRFLSNPISPKSSPLLSRDNIYAGSLSKSSLSPRGDYNNTASDFIDEQQMREYLSFLNESQEDLVLGHGGDSRHSIVNNADAHSHRRSYSVSDICFGPEETGTGMGYKPCLYFAKGFCKNGSNCKFAHSALADTVDAASGSGAIVGSPSKFEGLEQREENIRLRTAQHQRLMAASQLMAGASPPSYDKYINFLMQQQHDPQRAAAAAAVMMGDEFYRVGQCRPDRNDFLAMVSADKPNSPSRQIYLTFPAESTFKDEDVSEYFSKFGPVQDVRIPYQQKRMFGFVTFVHPETVRLILSKGNPHFICDSRVLVKPYKEKGKVPEKRQQLQQPQFEGGELSPCLSPTGLGSKEPYNFHLGGARMFGNPHEMLLRRKLEEQAELRQVLELQERRLMNLHLPDFKNNHIRHHQRSLSIGASLPLPQLHCHISNPGLSSSDSIKGDIAGFSGNLVSTMPLQPQQGVDPACINSADSRKGKDKAYADIIDLHSRRVEQALPDSLSASPTKAAGDNLPGFSTLAEVNESAAFSTCLSSQNKLEPQITFGDMASH